MSDPIEELLKATGKRPDVPEARRNRVRAAVRETWTGEISARAGRRRARTVFWLSAAGLALAIAISVFEWPWGSAKASGLEVSRAQGDAWAEHGPWIARSADGLHEGVAIVVGALVTTDTHAKVSLRDALGRSIRLDGGTALRVISSDRFELRRGAVYLDTGPGHADLHIDTPFGVIRDLGTQFQARLEGNRLLVRVREGKVTLRGQTRPATAGAGQVIVADGSKVALADDPARAQGWEWVESAAPVMAIDGRSLAEFVTWVAHERGVRVLWADPALEARAPTIKLRGSIDGMTVDRATETVMSTTGVPYRWSDGLLIVGK